MGPVRWNLASVEVSPTHGADLIDHVISRTVERANQSVSYLHLTHKKTLIACDTLAAAASAPPWSTAQDRMAKMCHPA